MTYLFEGEILHWDSLGSLQAIRPGGINLMLAGRGIVHSERERPEVTAADHRLHGLQLWLALPGADEEAQLQPGQTLAFSGGAGGRIRIHSSAGVRSRR